MNTSRILPLICGVLIAFAGTGITLAESDSDARPRDKKECRDGRKGHKKGDDAKAGSRRPGRKGEAEGREGSRRGKGGHAKGEGEGGHEGFRAKMLEKFDKDGDGELSKEERHEMFKAMRARHSSAGKGGPSKGGPGHFRGPGRGGFDKGGPGKGGPGKGGPGQARARRGGQDSKDNDRPSPRGGRRGPRRR